MVYPDAQPAAPSHVMEGNSISPVVPCDVLEDEAVTPYGELEESIFFDTVEDEEEEADPVPRPRG